MGTSPFGVEQSWSLGIDKPLQTGGLTNYLRNRGRLAGYPQGKQEPNCAGRVRKSIKILRNRHHLHVIQSQSSNRLGEST